MKKLLILLLFPLLGFSQVIGGVDFDVKYFSFLPDSVKTTMRTELIAAMNGALTAGNDLPLLDLTPTRTRYVAPGGAGTQDGLSEANAWTAATAISNAAPGDLIWMAPGDYGDQNLTFSTNGTAANPIYWIGYKTTTDDINASNGPDLTNAAFLTNSSDLLTADYPTFTGGPQSDDRYYLNGTNMTVTADYNVFRNIQSRRFQISWLVSGDYNVFDNLNFANNRWDRNNSISGSPEVDGTGIEIRNGQRNEVINCFAAENGFRHFMISDNGNYNRIAYCESHSNVAHFDNATTGYNAVDYHFVVINGIDALYSEYNMLENNYTGRYWDGTAWGHGMDFNTNARHNVARNNTIYNAQAHNHGKWNSWNIKANNYYEGGVSEYPSINGYVAGGSSYIDGAIYNYSYGNVFDDSYRAISFADQGKENDKLWDTLNGSGQPNANDVAGWHNIFVRDTITLPVHTPYNKDDPELSAHLFVHWVDTVETQNSLGNQFHEMDFNTANAMFDGYKETAEWLIIESTVDNVDSFAIGERSGRAGYHHFPYPINTDTEFNNVTLTNSFSIPGPFSVTSTGYSGGSPPANPISGNRRIFNKLFYEH